MKTSPLQSGQNVTIAAKHLRELHLYLSLISFVFLIFFCATGIALNHPEWVPDTEEIQWQQAELGDVKELEAVLRQWGQTLTDEQQRTLIQHGELDLESPGRRHYFTLNTTEQGLQLDMERVSYGWLVRFNELHQNRHTASAWRWISDLVSFSLILICLTGLILSLRPKKQRILRISLLTLEGAWLLQVML